MAYFPNQGPFDPHAPRAQASAGAFNPHAPRPATAKTAAVAHPVVVAARPVQMPGREVLNRDAVNKRPG